VLLLNPDTEVYEGTLDAAFARPWSKSARRELAVRNAVSEINAARS
jgi:hypothetical protein